MRFDIYVSAVHRANVIGTSGIKAWMVENKVTRAFVVRADPGTGHLPGANVRLTPKGRLGWGR